MRKIAKFILPKIFVFIKKRKMTNFTAPEPERKKRKLTGVNKYIPPHLRNKQNIPE